MSKCGSNELWAWGPGWVEIDAVYDDGSFTWGRVEPKEIGDFHCHACGYAIEFEDEEGISEWIMAHCDQETSKHGQAEEGSSGGTS